MRVVCISGKAMAGKDTFASMLKSELECSGQKVIITHFGDLLKYICSAFFEWNGEKDEHGRTLLQHIGTDIVRARQPDYWVNFMVGILKLFDNEWDYVLISDCRFPNEIDMLKAAGHDVTHVRIERDNFTSPLTKGQRNHSSETALDNITPDYLVYNRGTLECLRKEVENWSKDRAGGHKAMV